MVAMNELSNVKKNIKTNKMLLRIIKTNQILIERKETCREQFKEAY